MSGEESDIIFSIDKGINLKVVSAGKDNLVVSCFDGRESQAILLLSQEVQELSTSLRDFLGYGKKACVVKPKTKRVYDLEGISYSDKAEGKDIIRIVETTFVNLKEGDINSSCKVSEVVRARCIAIHFIHKLLGLSSVKVGRLVGKNHATILLQLKKFEDYCEELRQFKVNVSIGVIHLYFTDIVRLISRQLNCEAKEVIVNGS